MAPYRRRLDADDKESGITRVRFLNNILKRRPEMEHLEALRKIFTDSRPEDIAKVFELGRIEALNKLRRDLYYFISIVGSIVTILTFLFGFLFVPAYINSIVDARVEKEIDKRIDKFSNFYSYTKEVIPIMEYDFYRIKSVKTFLQIKNNQKIENIIGTGWQISPQFNLLATFMAHTDHFEFLSLAVDRRDANVIHDSDAILSKPAYKYLINNQIDVFQNFNYLEIKISMDSDPSKYRESVFREYSEKLDNYIDSIDEIDIETYVNKVSFYKNTIKRNDLKKSDTHEYSYTINWRDIFQSDGSVRKLYIRLVGSEKRKN